MDQRQEGPGRDPMAAFGKSSSRRDTEKKRSGVIFGKAVTCKSWKTKRDGVFFWGIHGKFSEMEFFFGVSMVNFQRWSFFWGIHGKFSGECMCMSGRLWYVSELALNDKWNRFSLKK